MQRLCLQQGLSGGWVCWQRRHSHSSGGKADSGTQTGRRATEAFEVSVGACKFLYSSRRVSAGSILATRRVGTVVAKSVTTESVRTTTSMVGKSYTPTP